MPIADYFEANHNNADLDQSLPALLHGFATACACLTLATVEEEQLSDWWQALRENVSDHVERNALYDFNGELYQHVIKQAQAIENSLNDQERVWLPFNPSPDSEALSDWAAAFMIVVMQDEEFWHKHESMDEALLPIIVYSGLFEDDEITKIEEDEDLLHDMAEEIPELITDIYLLLNSEH